MLRADFVSQSLCQIIARWLKLSTLPIEQGISISNNIADEEITRRLLVRGERRIQFWDHFKGHAVHTKRYRVDHRSVQSMTLFSYHRPCWLARNYSCVSVERNWIGTTESEMRNEFSGNVAIMGEYQHWSMSETGTFQRDIFVWSASFLWCQSGYGQCSYLRFVDNEGNVSCSMITGKSRVSPLRHIITIPRFELTATSVSAKVGCQLEKELNYPNMSSTYWIDSKVVLGYIHNDVSRFHAYVTNCVQLIRENTDVKMLQGAWADPLLLRMLSESGVGLLSASMAASAIIIWLMSFGGAGQYLPALQQRSKWSEMRRNLEVGQWRFP